MNADRWNTLRVRSVWLLVVPFLWLARPTSGLLVAGAAVAAVGVGIRAWAAGTIVKNRVLTTGGPYAHTRNPLYVGTFFLGLGMTVASGRWSFPLLFLAYFVWIYGRTMRNEARQLEEKFGEVYGRYARGVPLFFPRPTPWRPEEDAEEIRSAGFALTQYRRHKEWEAALGVAAGFVVLAAKWWWAG